MKNKKKLILIGVSSVFVIILGIGLYLWFNKDNDTQVYENKKEEQVKEQISGFNGISMMYETGPGTGEYSESKSSLWPEDGYIFNDTLSGCENGGELSWNSETNTVNLLSNSSDACYVYFDAYIIPVINSVTTSNITTDSITLTVNATNGNNQITTYYYSNNNGSSYETSNSNTYTFSGLDMGTVYNFSVYVEDSAGYKSEVYTLSETTDDTPPTLADVCSNGNNLASCITNYHNSYGSDITNIYYHTSSLANSAGDNSYRYAGANPNNYVCFGSNASTCPSDNLYRIIGVFGNEVKLIKADYAQSNLLGTNGDYYSSSYSGVWGSSSYYKGSLSQSSIPIYYWNSGGSNTWSASSLNTVNLNTNFLNNIGSTWSNLIATHSWKVGGITTTQIRNQPSVVYGYEVGSSSSSTTYSAKIGLMYISDYGFATENSNWTTTLNSTSISTNNWMYMGMSEWTISRDSGNSNGAFYVYAAGNVNGYNVGYSYIAVRPSFYLNSSVTYARGTGEASNPIRVN